LHLGEISLECSRPGASAAALWATQKLLPLVRGGEFASGLERGREAALQFFRSIENSEKFEAAFEPELDILVFVPEGDSIDEVSEKSRRIFAETARMGLHLALAELPVKFWQRWRLAKDDSEKSVEAAVPRTGRTVTCLRSVLMKPEHLEWVGRIIELAENAAAR
jgi:glutamate/tyrosine decarboxylase-like PLP-dependent enzyme